MKPILYDDIPIEPLSEAGRVLSIGVYDGVHRGHQTVIRRASEEARSRRAPFALLTFDRLPEEILRPEKAPKRLMDLDEKIEALSALQPDEIVIMKAKPELFGLSPREFATNTLRAIFQPSAVVIGADFRYGKGGAGSAEMLTEDMKASDCEVIAVPPVTSGEEKVSSTRIRNALSRGDVRLANSLLTRPYRLSGEVIYGKRQGRELGFPTANLEIDAFKLIPGNGVYACLARIEEGAYPAAVNVGIRPTFDDGERISVEAHLLDFSSDLYERRIKLEFLRKIRDETKFSSLGALRERLSRDIEETREITRQEADRSETETHNAPDG